MTEKHDNKHEVEVTNYVDQVQVKRDVATIVAASGCPICLSCSCSGILTSVGGFLPGGGGNNYASQNIFG